MTSDQTYRVVVKDGDRIISTDLWAYEPEDRDLDDLLFTSSGTHVEITPEFVPAMAVAA